MAYGLFGETLSASARAGIALTAVAVGDGGSRRFFFALDARIAHAHGVRHLFVMAGSATHYVAILRYVL